MKRQKAEEAVEEAEEEEEELSSRRPRWEGEEDGGSGTG